MLSGAVVFLALYQGAVPPVARLLFDADQRFAPALGLPSPWWWITCVAIVAVAGCLLAAIHTGEQQSSPGPSGAPSGATTQRDEGTGIYDETSGSCASSGSTTAWRRSLPGSSSTVPAPRTSPATPGSWWWITSITVVVATVVLLTVIDEAKQRRFPDG